MTTASLKVCKKRPKLGVQTRDAESSRQSAENNFTDFAVRTKPLSRRPEHRTGRNVGGALASGHREGGLNEETSILERNRIGDTTAVFAAKFVAEQEFSPLPSFGCYVAIATGLEAAQRCG